MWISKTKYESEKQEYRKTAHDLNRQNHDLNRQNNEYVTVIMRLNYEINRLTGLINGKTGDCNVGPWCDRCKHKGVTFSDLSTKKVSDDSVWAYTSTQFSHKTTRICLKHVREICPEYESEEVTVYPYD